MRRVGIDLWLDSVFVGRHTGPIWVLKVELPRDIIIYLFSIGLKYIFVYFKVNCKNSIGANHLFINLV